jgi:hypothetical protein
MTTKLTLSLEENVIKEAKVLAKTKGKSLSGLVENYLKSLIDQKNKENADEISPFIRSLLGCVPQIEGDPDYKEVVAEELVKKYNR